MPTPRTRRRGASRPREHGSRVVTGVVPEHATPAQVARRFRSLIESGARLRPAGTARARPAVLLGARYLPRYELRLFDATYFLGDYRFDDAVGFFTGFLHLAGEAVLWPRVFYKDSALLWRVASHFVRERGAVWIGKGDSREEERDGWVWRHSAEETANLPYELQLALDELSHRRKRRRDDGALALFVRRAPPGRIQAYADFGAPRRRAAARHRENAGRPVARFLCKGDPASLRFERGYEPDLARGVLERGASPSAFYGGLVEKVRVLSTNRRVQYLFFASPTHVWLGPPQLLTTELSSYGVRTLDVAADEDAFLPAFEYHEAAESQIPAGFAGAPHPENPDRADARAWLEALPIVREFRARVLKRRTRRAGK